MIARAVLEFCVRRVVGNERAHGLVEFRCIGNHPKPFAQRLVNTAAQAPAFVYGEPQRQRAHEPVLQNACLIRELEYARRDAGNDRNAHVFALERRYRRPYPRDEHDERDRQVQQRA